MATPNPMPMMKFGNDSRVEMAPSTPSDRVLPGQYPNLLVFFYSVHVLPVSSDFGYL